MAGYLVFRPSTSDNFSIPYDLNGILVNGADGPGAIAAAKAALEKIVGTTISNEINSWTALQLNASDFSGGVAPTVMQGPIVRPNQHLRGGGIIVT